jgi:hypothetical protein
VGCFTVIIVDYYNKITYLLLSGKKRFRGPPSWYFLLASLQDYLGCRILFYMIKRFFYFRSQQNLKQLTKGFFISKFLDNKNISSSWDQKIVGLLDKFFFVFPLFICSKSIKNTWGPRLDIFSLKDYLGCRILFCMIKRLFYFRSQQNLKRLTKGFFFLNF